MPRANFDEQADIVAKSPDFVQMNTAGMETAFDAWKMHEDSTDSSVDFIFHSQMTTLKDTSSEPVTQGTFIRHQNSIFEQKYHFKPFILNP